MHLFNRVKFRTPESVELEFTLAGIGNRAWALLIDYLVLAVILVVVFIVWLTVSVQLADFLSSIFGDRVRLWMIAIASLVGFGIYSGYFVIFETIWHGQTPGKRLANIRVVRDDARPIGLQQVTLRALLRPFDEFFYMGAFLIIFTRREKRLGDLAAGTIVIQAQTPITKATINISEQAKAWHQELEQIADLSALLPDDIVVISEYLRRRGAMTAKARAILALELANQAQAIINLENLPPNIEPNVFLEAVYLAYQQK